MRDNIIKFLATGGLVGYLPKMPGTFGTLVAIPLAWPFLMLDYRAGAGVLILFLAFSSYISGEAEILYGGKDPGKIVIDEIMGFLVTVYLLPFTAFNIILGFLLFRFFDILKPFPIRRFDKGLGGGFGVVFDDVLAGIYANISLHIIIKLWSYYG